MKLKSFDEIRGPKGLPYFGTAFHYIVKWNGLSFDKMFDVSSFGLSVYIYLSIFRILGSGIM